MKSRARHTTAFRLATADLFAAAPSKPAAPVLSAAPVVPAAPVLSAATPAMARAMPPLAHAAASRPRTSPLWYAVVFPELAEPQAVPMLQHLSLAAQRFTSLVSMEMPNALLLEIKGSVKLFGSLAALHADLAATWNRLSMRAHGATAPTALAALWLARGGREVCVQDPGKLAGALAELPIACTSWDPPRLQTLRAMGVTRVGELLRLPRAGLARRLRPDAVLDLDIALARQPAPRRACVPTQRFRERCDFEVEIATAACLQIALRPLLARCAQFLRRRQAGIQSLALKLRHRDMPVTRVRVRLASVTGELGRLTDVAEEKLNRLELKAPVRGMELLSDTLQPLPADSLDAFAGLRAGGRGSAAQLVERLRARLGEASVYGIVTVPEHRPEAAWQRVHELHLRSAAGAETRVLDMPRPVWLLAEPMMLSPELQPLLPGGPVIEQGPERIESGWWDGKGVARDYYVARQTQGARWWIFQERQTRSWYLHGVFA